MILIDKLNKFLIILFFFLIHLVTINLWPVNFENNFSEAAKFSINFDLSIFKNFTIMNANTYIFSLIASIFYKFFYFLTPLHITKILSASSYIFLGCGIIQMHKNFSLNCSVNILIFVIFLNPIIWTLGFRGTPDLISLSLAFFSISFLIDKKIITIKKYFFLFVLSFSILLKPHALSFLFIYFFFNIFYDTSLKLKKFLITSFESFLPMIPLALYTLFNFKYLDIFGINLIYIKMYTEQNFFVFYDNYLIFFIQNLVLYSGFITLFIAPLFCIDLLKKINFIKYYFISVILLSFFIFYFNLLPEQNSGEMDLGFLGKFVNQQFFNFLLITSFITLLCCLIHIFLNINKSMREKIIYIFLFFIFFYLVSVSFFRPVQRFLIFIIPFIFFLYFNFNKFNYLSFFVYVIFFSFLNVLILHNHFATSLSAKKIFNYIDSNNLIDLTYPGALNAHGRHMFNVKNLSTVDLHNLNERKFIVSSSKNENTIFSTESGILPYFKKKYYLNKYIKN